MVSYRKGKEKNIRIDGEYFSKFIEESEEKYIVRLDFINEDTKNTPISFICEHLIQEDLDDSSVKLLKQYGPEEESNYSISYPEWNTVASNICESKMHKTSSLNEFEKLIHTWRKQLSEILIQTYNSCAYLTNEYIIINNVKPPIGSPISIRSFKTSILSNTILYIESIANFYISLAIEINSLCPGAPKNNFPLTQKEIERLLEKNNFLSLEKKLYASISKINTLTKSNLNLAKDHDWDNFIAIKEKRNSITHAKIADHKTHIVTSLDHMISSVKITDLDLMSCVECIIWLNEFTDTLFEKISIKKDFHDFSFNSHDVLSLLGIISNINGISYDTALAKNNLVDPFNI